MSYGIQKTKLIMKYSSNYPTNTYVAPLLPTEGHLQVIHGKAYTGNGRSITKVEVSVDSGETWGEADMLVS